MDVRRQRAGDQGFRSLSRFLSTRLQRQVNAAQSAVGRPWERTVLGRLVDPPGRSAVVSARKRSNGSRRAGGRARSAPGAGAERAWHRSGAGLSAGGRRTLGPRRPVPSSRHGLRGFRGVCAAICGSLGPRGYTARRTRGVSRDVAWNTAKSAHGAWRLSRSLGLAMALPGCHFEGLGVPRLSIQGASQLNRRGT